MFIGEYNHNLDEKGRLAIPVKFRALLKKGGVVTKGLDNCLFLLNKSVITILKRFSLSLSDLIKSITPFNSSLL